MTLFPARLFVNHRVQMVKEEDMGTTLRVAGGWVRDKLVGQEQGFHQRNLSKVEKMDIDIALDNCMGGDFANKLSRYLSKVTHIANARGSVDAGVGSEVLLLLFLGGGGAGVVERKVAQGYRGVPPCEEVLFPTAVLVPRLPM